MLNEARVALAGLSINSQEETLLGIILASHFSLFCLLVVGPALVKERGGGVGRRRKRGGKKEWVSPPTVVRELPYVICLPHPPHRR